jgi:hypothetical protein
MTVLQETQNLCCKNKIWSYYTNRSHSDSIIQQKFSHTTKNSAIRHKIQSYNTKFSHATQNSVIQHKICSCSTKFGILSYDTKFVFSVSTPLVGTYICNKAASAYFSHVSAGVLKTTLLARKIAKWLSLKKIHSQIFGADSMQALEDGFTKSSHLCLPYVTFPCWLHMYYLCIINEMMLWLSKHGTLPM